MRTALMLALVAVFALVSVGAALAQTPAPNLEVKGAISAIDKTVTPPTVTITPKEGSPVTLKIVASTIIIKAGLGKASLDDLAVNDRAVATYNQTSMEASRLAVSQPIAKHHTFVGTIKSKASASFVVTTKQGDATVNVNAQTKYNVPGVKNATLANFKEGDKVAVLAVETSSGNLVLHVVLIPGKPTFIHRVGTVDAYVAGTSITLKDKKGELSTFIVTADTKIVLKRGATAVSIGEQAIVVARRNPATDQFTAMSILVFGAK
ncbi:MAG: hypothetical protein HY676_04535 [Chloroflexi bacterium]|nr:hypothetical protein [Chloroflexota bacterium]